MLFIAVVNMDLIVFMKWGLRAIIKCEICDEITDLWFVSSRQPPRSSEQK